MLNTYGGYLLSATGGLANVVMATISAQRANLGTSGELC